MDETLSPMDPLEFVDQKSYPDRVKDSQEKTGMQDALRTGTGERRRPAARGRPRGRAQGRARAGQCASSSAVGVALANPPTRRHSPCAAQACSTASPWRWA